MFWKRMVVATLVFSVAMVGGNQSANAAGSKGAFHPIARVDNKTIWVRIQKHNGGPVSWAHSQWWKNGNTTNDTYSFAIGHTAAKQIVVQVSFSQYHNYVEAIIGVQHSQQRWVVKTNSGSWLVNGRTNYGLLINHYQSGKLLETFRVGELRPGVPQWETGRMINNPHPHDALSRFGATLRMHSAPEFNVASPFWPNFPYLGFGSGSVNWFNHNPWPFYYDVSTQHLVNFPIVGFEEAGMYRINSLTGPPKVDFESPFAFYGFRNNSRYADLVIRAQQYPKGDQFSAEKVDRQQSYYRMSWKTNNVALWQYSLSVQGFHSTHSTIKIGPYVLNTPSPGNYPSWVASHSWPYVTFVQAMKGYPGSEGIYFDSGSSAPSVWPWLDGFSNHSPSYLQRPVLIKRPTLTNKTSESLPVGYRADSNANYFARPQVYFDPMDGLVHLWRATGGVENLGKGWLLQFKNLSGGTTMDGWVRVHIGKQGKQTVVSRLYSVGSFLVYASHGSVQIFRIGPSALTPIMVPIPTSKVTWESFVRDVGASQQGKTPWHFSKWFAGMSLVPIKSFLSADLSHVSISQGRFKSDLVKSTSETSRTYILRGTTSGWTLKKGQIITGTVSSPKMTRKAKNYGTRGILRRTQLIMMSMDKSPFSQGIVLVMLAISTVSFYVVVKKSLRRLP